MPQFWEGFGSRELLYLLQVLFFFPVSMSTISVLSKPTVCSVKIDLSQYKIMLIDSSSGSGLYLQYGGFIYQVACTLWPSVDELRLPDGCLPRYANLRSDEPSICCVAHCFVNFIKFCAYVDHLTLLSSASHYFWF